jgi:hypothetical protein
MDPKKTMESSEFHQASTMPRKRTNRIANNDVSAGCTRNGKKARLSTPIEAQHQKIPSHRVFRIAEQKAFFAKTLISLKELKKQSICHSPEAEKLPVFTTFQETWRDDELVGCQILGSFKSMDEANHKVIESWDPAWPKHDGRAAQGTKEDGAIWWQREKMVSCVFPSQNFTTDLRGSWTW